MLLETSLRWARLEIISQFRPAEHQLMPIEDPSQQQGRLGFSMGTATHRLDQRSPRAAKAAVVTRSSVFPNDGQMCFHS